MGLLISKQLEEKGLEPLGFVANDYATLIWGLEEVFEPKSLFLLKDFERGMDSWLAENALMKRSFRAVATISGLIERNFPGQRKSGRQATFSSDIIYDTLRKFEPDHLMMRITRTETMTGLIDFSRIRQMLENVEDRRIYPILDQMNFDKFMGWPEEDFTVWSYMQDPNDKLPDGHLGVASHKHLAVLLNDKIKELYG